MVLVVASFVAMTGCGAAKPTDVRTALDAVAAARDAARAELPDHPVVNGAVQILDVALSLAARAVSAVITILDGAGVEIPDVITSANETLQRWLN
jgi:hypothetical protein